MNPRLKKNNSCTLIASLAFVFILSSGLLFAAEEPTSQSLLAKVKQLETRLTQIETDQKAILEKQDKITQQLETLRVWVRRS